MGQNDDVVWTFTNTVADVQDLFIERIEGDRYLFEGEWLPLAEREEEIIGQGPGAAGERCSVRSTHHGPLVNEALGADAAEPLALSWVSLQEPTAHAGMFERPRRRLRSGAGRLPARATRRRSRA